MRFLSVIVFLAISLVILTPTALFAEFLIKSGFATEETCCKTGGCCSEGRDDENGKDDYSDFNFPVRQPHHSYGSMLRTV